MSVKKPTLSVVVPVFNEAAGLLEFHQSLIKVLNSCLPKAYEIIYCDDGSTDETAALVRTWAKREKTVKLVKLSRNFGKESALAAGVAVAQGEATLMIDGDGQHPVALIPEFVKAWQAGAQVVIGVRTENSGEGFTKRLGSQLFYKIFNHFTKQTLVPGSTDFRLIAAPVRLAFLELKESDRITRGLIDWLGFERVFIEFTAGPRQQGSAGYDRRKLFHLATNSFVSLSTMPLYLFGYLGVVITFASLVLGLTVGVEQLILNDPWHWNFTGTALLSIMLLFLVGIVLMSQGMLALYISHIHTQSKQRPLYVIDYDRSAGLGKDL